MTKLETTLLPCPADRFWSKVKMGDSCWEWIGATNGQRGYGKLGVGGRFRLAHVVSYEMSNGPVPRGLVVDHICNNRRCVNPAHLRAITPRANTLRGNGLTAINSRKTHCTHGHILSADNIKIIKRRDGTRRKCLTCAQEYNERRRKKNG